MEQKYYNRILTGLAISLFFVSCGGHGDSKQVIQNHFNALNAHDVNRLLRDYAPKVEVTSSGWEGIHNGPNEVKAAYGRYFRSSRDMRYDVGNVYFSGDSVVTVEYTMAATLTSPEAGEPVYMLGKRYLLNCCSIFTIRNKKIVKEATYFDQVSFLRQVGYFEHNK